MRLRRLILDGFGPFRHYEFDLPEEDTACLLLTGKNNQGKSTLIQALRLLHGATKVARRIVTGRSSEGDLLRRDTEDLDVPRLMHDYEASKATIVGEFVGFRLEVRLDAETGRITCVPSRRIPRDTWSDYMLDKVRLPFGASRHVVALLLEQLDLVPKGFYASKRAIWEQRQPYFRATTVRRTGHTKRQRRLTALGAPLISLLSQAHENGAMSKLDLAEVLDMKVEQVEDFGSWVRDEWRRQGD